MGTYIDATYASDAHYWEKYPELFEGSYTIDMNILNHEINKYSLCDNTYAREKYGWLPRYDMREGLSILIKSECDMLSSLSNK